MVMLSLEGIFDEALNKASRHYRVDHTFSVQHTPDTVENWRRLEPSPPNAERAEARYRPIRQNATISDKLEAYRRIVA